MVHGLPLSKMVRLADETALISKSNASDLACAVEKRASPSEHWRDKAVCSDTLLVGLFFPEVNKNYAKSQAAAIDMCIRCPVKLDCGLEAIEVESQDGNSSYGVRGGIIPKHRVSLIKEQKSRTAG